MKIGICAIGPISKDSGGQTYLVNLIRALQSLDQTNEFIIFVSPGEGDVLSINRPNFTKVYVPNTSSGTITRVIGEHFKLPPLIKRHQIDVMYYPGNFASLYCPSPFVVAIRSMLYYHYPYAIDKARLFYRKALTPYSARRANAIIAPSQDIKNDICRFIGINENKVHVIHHGVNVNLFDQSYKPEEYLAVMSKLGIRSPFLLYVSALWEYKNHDKLILAFKSLIDQHNIPHQLVLAGKGINSVQHSEAKLKSLIADLKLQDRVIMPGFLGHDQLKYLYQRCDVFVFPSSYESFGNPLFEAMAAGAPVVASNVHSFPEMAKDAALLVNPLDIQELADNIFKLISDNELKNSFIIKGKQRVKDFSWHTCAQQTLNIIGNKC